MDRLIVDPEFRDKIPPMPKEDFDGLRSDIIRDGYVRDPLVVWKEENTLLDGHHRWTVICENWEMLKDKYTIDYKSFPDRWAAIAWICANQLHKHNMTEMQRMKLIQEEHDARQKSWGGARKSSGEIRHLKNDVPETVRHGAPSKELKTRPTIAKEHGITESEVKTAVEVGRGIDRAAKVDPEFKREVLSGEVKATKKDLSEIRKIESDEEVAARIDKIRSPAAKTNSEKSEYAKNRQLIADIRKTNAEMASGKSKNYTEKDLVAEIRALRDEFIGKVKQTLKVRADVIGDGDKVLDVLVSCERKIMEIEDQIGGKTR